MCPNVKQKWPEGHPKLKLSRYPMTSHEKTKLIWKSSNMTQKWPKWLQKWSKWLPKWPFWLHFGTFGGPWAPLGAPLRALGAQGRFLDDFGADLGGQMGSKWGPKRSKNRSKINPVLGKIFDVVLGAKSDQNGSLFWTKRDLKTISKRFGTQKRRHWVRYVKHTWC